MKQIPDTGGECVCNPILSSQIGTCKPKFNQVMNVLLSDCEVKQKEREHSKIIASVRPLGDTLTVQRTVPILYYVIIESPHHHRPHSQHLGLG